MEVYKNQQGEEYHSIFASLFCFFVYSCSLCILILYLIVIFSLWFIFLLYHSSAVFMLVYPVSFPAFLLLELLDMFELAGCHWSLLDSSDFLSSCLIPLSDTLLICPVFCSPFTKPTWMFLLWIPSHARREDNFPEGKIVNYITAVKLNHTE